MITPCEPGDEDTTAGWDLPLETPSGPGWETESVGMPHPASGASGVAEVGYATVDIIRSTCWWIVGQSSLDVDSKPGTLDWIKDSRTNRDVGMFIYPLLVTLTRNQFGQHPTKKWISSFLLSEPAWSCIPMVLAIPLTSIANNVDELVVGQIAICWYMS